MSASPKDYLHLHFLVLLWGFTAILGLLILIPPVEVVFYRTFLSALGLAMIMYIKRIPFKIGSEEIMKILLTGFLIAAHWILFFASARVSTASVCLAGMATTAFWTSLIEPLALKKSIKWFEMILGLVVIVGLYIIFHFEVRYTLGLVMALGSALLAAIFTVINGRFTLKHNHYTITFYEMIGAVIGTGLFFPVYIHWFSDGGMLNLSINWMDLLYISILAFVCTVYAYSASIQLMKKMSAFVVNLTINMEPVYGIVFAFLIFGDKERMVPGFYIGALVILLSVLAYPVLNRRYHRRYLGTDNLR